MLTHSKIKQAKPKEKVYKLSNEKGCSGLVNSISDDEGKRSDFLYDAASRLTAIIAPNDDRINVVFDAGGRLLEKNIANGTRTQYSYDAGNKLTQLVNRTGHGIVSQHDYSYDSVGRRTGHIENIAQSTSSYNYNYDNLNRMTQVLKGGVLEEAYTYDQFSNRRTKQSNGQATHYLLYDKAQQLTSIKSGSDTGTQIASFTYDSKGNLINKTVGADSQTYTYDALERLIKAEGNHIVSENYAYDHKGRRISKKVGENQSQYVYAGKSIYAEYGSNWNGAIAHYTYSGLDQVAIRSTPSAADTRYYHNDGLNSVVAVTNSAGITQASNRFDAWGKVLSGGQTPQFGFTGREPDATGLVHFRARFYDPSQGRFTQRDPAGFSDGINPYIYVGNSPQNFTDPLGLAAQAVSAMDGWGSTYDGASDDPLDSLRNAANTAWNWATAWNFEGRDAINTPFEHLSEAEVKNSDEWGNLDGWQAKEHQNGGLPDTKYIHFETGAELVYDGDLGTLINSGEYKGTGNYVNAMPMQDLTLFNFPEFVVMGLGHLVVDWAPAKVLGVER